MVLLEKFPQIHIIKSLQKIGNKQEQQITPVTCVERMWSHDDHGGTQSLPHVLTVSYRVL